MNPTLAPESIHAVIVGIEQFDVGWNLAGPASDAVRFAEWVWKKMVPAKNIHLFLSPLPKNQTKIEEQCQKLGIEYEPAIRAHVRKMVVERLPELTGSLLFLYWSGHGFVVDGSQRRLLYADASKKDFKNFMLDQALEKLRSTDFSHFSHQIAFIDACANTYETLPQDEIPKQGKLNPQTRQFVLFSAGLGKTAINRQTKNTTEFGQCLLKTLERKKTEFFPPRWEELEEYFNEIGNDIDKHFQILEKQGAPNQSPVQFRWQGWSGNERVRGSELGQAEVRNHDRLLRWLSVFPLPRIQTINPYQDLHLTKGEVSLQYDFENLENLPPYIPRDTDQQLDEHLRKSGGKLIVLVGPSKAGKSRMAFEALIRNCGDCLLIVPDEIRDLRHILENYQEMAIEQGKGVLWLDNFHEYLYAETIGPGTIQRLITNEGLLVMATMWDEEYRRLKKMGVSSTLRDSIRETSPVIGQTARDILAHAIGLRVESEITPSEKKWAEKLYPNRGFHFGIGESFVARNHLIESFIYGTPELKAIVRAAGDLYRVGVCIPIPIQHLKDLFKPYFLLEAPTSWMSEEEWDVQFHSGLKQALTPVGKYQCFLNKDPAGADAFKAFDPIVYHLDNPANGSSSPIPAMAWEAALKLADVDLFSVGLSAYERQEYSFAERVWRLQIKSGNRQAASNLGLLLIEKGEVEAAKTILQMGVDFGYAVAAYNLGVLLAKEGEVEEAKAILKTGMSLGHGGAAASLGFLLIEQGKVEEAKTVYQKGIELGEGRAAKNLGWLLNEQGEVEAAKEAYRIGIELGFGGAATNLGVLLAEQDELDEAKLVYQKGIKLGDGKSAHNLGMLLEKEGAIEAAKNAYQTGMDLKDGEAAASLGCIWQEMGDVEAAKAAFQAGVDFGSGRAANNLGVVLVEQEELQAAETAFLMGMDLGHGGAAASLGVLLVRQEQVEEAKNVYQRGMELDNGRAANNLGVLLAKEGDRAGAKTAYAKGMDLGDAMAAFNLGGLLNEEGDKEGAKAAYTNGMELDHSEAAYELGVLLAEQNEIDLAKTAYGTGMRLGHGGAASNLGVLLGKEGELEAAKEAFQIGIKFGHGESATNLGVILTQQGEVGGAKTAFQIGMDFGNSRAALHLGSLLTKQGEVEAAKSAFRLGVDLGNGGAANNLGFLLAQEGQIEEAKVAYRMGMDLGEGKSAYNLGVWLKNEGDNEGAEKAFSKANDLGFQI